MLVTLGLSQTESVGWWWDSRAELGVAADFASIGVLFYTASFAALETGVMTMVLAWKVKEYFDKKQRNEGIALAQEARRQKRDGETWEDAIERLKLEGWKPTKPQ